MCIKADKLDTLSPLARAESQLSKQPHPQGRGAYLKNQSSQHSLQLSYFLHHEKLAHRPSPRGLL